MGIELSPGASVALGILVGLVSTCVQSIGLTQQRKSHLLEEQKQEEHADHVLRPAYRRRRWQLGMLMFLVSNIVGSSIQITTLPLPVLSTLQASGLVFNTICATVVLGEPFTRFSFVGTVLVAAGAALIGIFGSVTEPSHSLSQLLTLLGRWKFILWLSSTFLIVVILIICMFILKRIHPRQTHRVRIIRGMAYGGISGILSAHTLLLAKSAVELLVRTIVDHVNQFNQWQSWMILVGLVMLALAQLYFLHRGLKMCSTSVLYPFVFCVYNVIAILDGLIYFDQSSRLPVRDAALIAVGTVILLGGVFALSWRLQADDDLPGPSVVDVKAKARVVTPRTMLQPGFGLQNEPESDDENELLIRPADDEEAIEQVKGRRPHEQTPLLRTKTGPSRPRAHTEQRDSTLRSPKLRRISTIQDDSTIDLWDELNDRPGSRRFSVEQSPHSVRSPITLRSHRRSMSGPHRSKTLPNRRRTSVMGITQLPWRLFNHQGSDKKKITGQISVSSPPPSDPTDGEDTEGDELENNEMRTEISPGSETRPNWVKLRKWWKKRWRSYDGGDGM
ncbi:uncharacterized protein PV09_00386 [Verruconis gallopava]|uniref:Uncharacterized protein n=1 Tax=Verruconis gallopava TaxID=253628 RepID=A0A0D2ASR8_9PEZI|nr:uncharacterized protein PV09_00386 [Verruconis gallopava]KIW09510.1 hypothetical protein PV09_00386 [Verruconis gallopava]